MPVIGVVLQQYCPWRRGTVVRDGALASRCDDVRGGMKRGRRQPEGHACQHRVYW